MKTFKHYLTESLCSDENLKDLTDCVNRLGNLAIRINSSRERNDDEKAAKLLSNLQRLKKEFNMIVGQIENDFPFNEGLNEAAEALKYGDDDLYQDNEAATEFFEELASDVNEIKNALEAIKEKVSGIDENDMFWQGGFEYSSDAQNFLDALRGINLSNVVNGINNYANHIGEE